MKNELTEPPDVWLLDTVRTRAIPPRPARIDELKVQISFLRQEVKALREQFDALMAQVANNPPPLRLHKPAALPSREQTSPIKRIELYKDQDVQCVRSFGHDDQIIEALCGPLDKISSLLRLIAGRRMWAETFSSQR